MHYGFQIKASLQQTLASLLHPIRIQAVIDKLADKMSGGDMAGDGVNFKAGAVHKQE